jgi:transposase
MSTSEQGRKRKSQRDYPLSFKLRVVEEVEKGVYTHWQARRQYGIQGKSTVLVWLRKHGTLQWQTQPRMSQVEKTPEQRIKELEAALQWERDRNLLLTTTIEIAEKQFGVVLPKKLRAKLSKNSRGKGA